MAETFEDIKIKSLDDAASGPSGQGALLRIVLKLSPTPPSPWGIYFNEAWNHNIYSMKRRASVIGDKIEIVCMPGELETDHLPELKKVIAESNQAYREQLAEKVRLRAMEEGRNKARQDELAKLKGRLNFD